MLAQMEKKVGSNSLAGKQINLPLDKDIRVNRGNIMFFTANEYLIKGDRKLIIPKIEKRKITPQIQ